MEIIIIKLIEKWWWMIVLALLLGMYIYGYKYMFFWQDDYDWFRMANQPFWQVIAAPLSDHINYLFRILLKMEWDVFGLNFPPYLAVSSLLHLGTIAMLYRVCLHLSKRRDLAAYASIVFSVNTNWTEVVLWTSGQTISISVLFVLIAIDQILKKRNEITSSILACTTSALALGLPISLFLTKGIARDRIKITKIGVGVIVIMISVVILYWWRATDGTQLEISLKWVIQVAEVMVLGVVNTVVGRLFVPFDKFETIRILIVMVATVILTWKYRLKVKLIWQDENSRFLILQLFFYYLIVAVGRAQYGVGIMRAERYAYLGLAYILLLAVRILRQVKIEKYLWVFVVLVIFQNIGFYRRASDYVQNPGPSKVVPEHARRSLEH